MMQTRTTTIEQGTPTASSAISHVSSTCRKVQKKFLGPTTSGASHEVMSSVIRRDHQCPGSHDYYLIHSDIEDIAVGQRFVRTRWHGIHKISKGRACEKGDQMKPIATTIDQAITVASSAMPVNYTSVHGISGAHSSICEPVTISAPGTGSPLIINDLTKDFDFLRAVVDTGLTTMMELVKSSFGITTEPHRSGGNAGTDARRRWKGIGAQSHLEGVSVTRTTEQHKIEKTQSSPSLRTAGSHIFHRTSHMSGRPLAMVDRMSQMPTQHSSRDDLRGSNGAQKFLKLSPLRLRFQHMSVTSRGRIEGLYNRETASPGGSVTVNDKAPPMPVGLHRWSGEADAVGAESVITRKGDTGSPHCLSLVTSVKPKRIRNANQCFSHLCNFADMRTGSLRLR